MPYWIQIVPYFIFFIDEEKEVEMETTGRLFTGAWNFQGWVFGRLYTQMPPWKNSMVNNFECTREALCFAMVFTQGTNLAQVGLDLLNFPFLRPCTRLGWLHYALTPFFSFGVV